MRTTQPARLRDVAQVANVSVATVSRHLNGTLTLPASTSARIAAAIRALNYVPNPHARRLSLGRSEMLGLLIPDIANPFFAERRDRRARHSLRRGFRSTPPRGGRPVKGCDESPARADCGSV